MSVFEIDRFSANDLEVHMEDFSVMLRDWVHAGASINFILPFDQSDAETFWRRKVLTNLPAGKLILLAAIADSKVVGTVQLNIDTPPNQPHRADVQKLMVHPNARRGGVAKALMYALEGEAKRHGRTLLVLDTVTGDTAEGLYASIGYEVAGAIPSFCIDALDGSLKGTTYMYKALG